MSILDIVDEGDDDMNDFPLPPIKACAFFHTSSGCMHGKSCNYSHDPNATPTTNLKSCPNQNCDNMCIGRQCRHCDQQKRQKRMFGKTEQIGPTESCTEETKYVYYPKLKWRQQSYHHRQKTLKMCRQCGVNKCMGTRCRQCHFGI